MLTEPRNIDSNGLYYPYIKTEVTNLHLFEGSLLAKKSEQICSPKNHQTKGSETLYASIDYLKSIKGRAKLI